MYMYVCTSYVLYECTCTCMYMYVYECKYMNVCMYVVYMYMYVCTHVCMYMYDTHTCTHIIYSALTRILPIGGACVNFY